MSENDCYFVSSRGILKSCDFHSSNPSSDSIVLDDISHLNHINKLKDNDTVYICTTLIPFFIITVLPIINKPFTLVSGDSDISITINDIMNSGVLDLINTLLNNTYLKRWFAQNCTIYHPKIFNLPIGLDYHSVNNINSTEPKLPIDKEKILMNIRQDMKPFYERKLLIYSNVRLRLDRHQERITALNTIPKDIIVEQEGHIQREEMSKIYTEYAFILSPFGNGFDCHRTYEALILGCIPIVKSNGSMDRIFDDLPVLIIKEWSEVTKDLLEKTVEDFKGRTFSYEKLSLKYWMDLIKLNVY